MTSTVYDTVARKGKIDVIFAGAAFVEKIMTATVTPEHFDKTFNTNVRGTYFTIPALIFLTLRRRKQERDELKREYGAKNFAAKIAKRKSGTYALVYIVREMRNENLF